MKRGAQTINVGFTADTTIGATENIAVLAGNFDAVIISLSLNLGGYAFSETLYLAEGIGIVKDVNTDSSGTLTADLVYTNAGIYDLAIMGITPPKKVTLSSGTPSRTSLLKLKVQNKRILPGDHRGRHDADKPYHCNGGIPGSVPCAKPNPPYRQPPKALPNHLKTG